MQMTAIVRLRQVEILGHHGRAGAGLKTGCSWTSDSYVRIHLMRVVLCDTKSEAWIVMDRKVVSPPTGEELPLAEHIGRGGMFMKLRWRCRRRTNY